MQIEFFVPGIPATAGSKRPFIYKSKKDGKQRVAMCPDNKRQKPWMSDVKYYAQMAMEGMAPLTGAVKMDVVFGFARPKAHYGSGKNNRMLKLGAPKHHTIKPDRTKLLRAAEDALKGVVWIDDSQVVAGDVQKVYSNTPGALVSITTVDSVEI